MLNRIVIFFKNHKLLTAILVVLIIAFAGTKLISFPRNPATKTAVSNPKVNSTVEKNISLYQPKYDFLKNHPGSLNLTAESAIVVDQNSGQILYAKNEHQKHWPASITKILTMVISLENYKPDQLCPVSEEASETQPDKISMDVGEKMKVEDLIYGMMMISANDAAEVLAECDPKGRSDFINKMNTKAASLGLKDSHFANPNGLDNSDHYSSAFDMATITRYAIMSIPVTLQYMGHKANYSVEATDHNEAHSWYQISHLLFTYPGMIAAKTGYTDEAKNTYVGIAKRDGRTIIIVYFGAQTTTSDATSLLDYGFSVNPTL
jgi:D-alanyl-D-alanine carboxypeptidase